MLLIDGDVGSGLAKGLENEGRQPGRGETPLEGHSAGDAAGQEGGVWGTGLGVSIVGVSRAVRGAQDGNGGDLE